MKDHPIMLLVSAYSVNNRHPYLITCNWNSLEGTIIFKSENILYDPQPILEANNITTMTVYIDRENPKKYLMSLEELTDKVSINI